MKPVLFLDFDRTLFDTDQFYDWLGEERYQRILELTSGQIQSPDFASYLYKDTIHFLKSVRKTYRIVILTYALNTVLQRKKIRGSGIIPLCDDVIITKGGEGDSTGKGVAAKDYIARIGDSGWEHTFVDDSAQNIDEVKRVNPEIRCIRIDRVPPSPATHDTYLPPDGVVVNLTLLGELL